MRAHFVRGGFLFGTLTTLIAAPGDERWSREFHAPDFGTVNAVAYTPGGDLICGGAFSGIAGVAGTANIARWDGTNWNSLGNGLASGTVYAVLPVGNDIYMGGVFTSVQGQSITNLARWDGTNWSPVGGGLTGGSVRSLTWHEGNLIAGGLFTSAGGAPVAYIAAWNGTSWSSLAGGMQASSPSGSAVPVGCLLSFNGSLWAGGIFFRAGGVDANNIARWNGVGWSSLGTGANNGTAGLVGALAGATNGTLFVGGSFATAGSNTVNNIAAWDGSTWSALNGGVRDPFSFVAGVGGLLVSGSDLLVSGNITQAGGITVRGLARWTGSAWTAVEYPGRHPASRIAGHGSRMVVAGRLLSMMVPSGRNGLIQFDGARWSILGDSIAGTTETPIGRTVSALHGKVQLSGSFAVSDGSGQRPTVAEWDGRIWSEMGDGLRVATLDDWHVHDFIQRNGLIHAAGPMGNVMVFSNNAWTALAPLPGEALSLAEFRGELFSGHAAGISRWMGAGWTNVGLGVGGAVNVLLALGDNLYAGGSFTTAGGSAANNIARWDGTNWFPLGQGVDSPVRALVRWQGQLVAGGSFFFAGQNFAFGVARWDGAQLHPLGEGLGDGPPLSEVRALTVTPGGQLFAGGNFSQSGPTNAISNIAGWNGTNWNGLGSGVNARVRSLAADENDLFVTGDFTTAGNVQSLRFARWRYPQNLRVELAAPTNGPEISLLARGEIGSRFAVEHSADLTIWTTLFTNSLLANPGSVPVATNGVPFRFFRLRSVP